MHFGFALFKFFPFGGLQRDLLAIARACVEGGHDVTVFCSAWEGEQPDFVSVCQIPVKGLSNHARDSAFARALARHPRRQAVQCLVGFNKMPDLDFYYAADSCFAAKVYEERSRVYRYLPRARQYLKMEASVFAVAAKTRILLISEAEMAVFQQYYQTPESRMRLLPPGIRRDRVMPADYPQRRQRFRAAQGWDEDEKLVLFVGSGFRTKGLDRAIRAFAKLPQGLGKSRLLVLGKDKTDAFVNMARQLGVGEQVQFLGGVDNVSDYLWAGDALLHPAYRENTGTVLLEAMVAGLPVITTGACGYAKYVRAEQMGYVLDNPVNIESLAQALADTLQAPARQWRLRGRAFADRADIFSMPERAAQLLESWA